MGLVAESDLTQMRGILDQLTNCALLKIQRPGSVDDWDRPTTAGATIWEGRAQAYIGRSLAVATAPRQESVTPAGVEAETTADTLTILDGRASLNIVAGTDLEASLLTIEDQRVTPSVTLTFRASSIRHQMFGLLDFTEIKLRDPTA